MELAYFAGFGIESGEQFVCEGDADDAFWLAGGGEPGVEVAEVRFVLADDLGDEEEDGANGGASAADRSFAFGLAAVLGDGGDAGELGDGLVGDAADLGEFGHQSGDGAVGDALDGAEGGVEPGPEGIGGDQAGDLSLAVVNETLLLAAIDRMYRRTEEISDLAHELEEELGESAIDFGLLGLTQNLEDAPVVRLLQTVFEDAAQIRASDIHIEPQEKTLQIRFRIDGVLHMQTEVDPKIATALALRLKLMSGLDISEKRVPQDGRFNVRVKNRSVDVRISTMPTQYGESVVMRLLNQDEGVPSLEKLGFPPEMLKRFRDIFHRSQGMVLVTGPTGSGKTTTLYAVLAELNSVERKIITVEDPVEYRLPGINQVQVNEKIDLSFSCVLRATLRQDPDIVLVGEMRDQETAQIGMRAAMTGHMVLSTLHTNDAVSTPIRLLDMGVPPYMAAMSVHAVLAQRLVRLVCDSCVTDYPPLPHELTWLALELGAEAARKRFVHGRGCSHCNGTGYHRRVGVYEMLEMTAPLVEALNHQDTHQFVKLAKQQLAGKTLRRAAVDLAVAGKTTVAEAMRVSNVLEE